jgi:sugar phosphate isomerase/epimerase
MGMNNVVPRAQRIAYAKECLSPLAEVAQSCGAVIAVENQPKIGLGRTYEEMLDVLSVDERLKFCLDVNHLLLETASEYVPMLADRLRTVHISDYDFKNERHWIPGEGDANWSEILSSLQGVGYSGVWMYEVSLTAPATIVRQRELTLRDLAENARALFAGEKPPFGGVRAEGLVSWK